MMYSTKDVLELLSISKPTLYKLCKKKGVAPKKICNHYRFSDLDIIKLTNQSLDTRDKRIKFECLVNDILNLLSQFSKQLYGKQGETKLHEILLRQKNSVFVMNMTHFKEIKNE